MIKITRDTHTAEELYDLSRWRMADIAGRIEREFGVCWVSHNCAREIPNYFAVRGGAFPRLIHHR